MSETAHDGINPATDYADCIGMPSNTEKVEARRAHRLVRHGNLMLFPRVERTVPIDAEPSLTIDEPRLFASISDVSESGVGLVLGDELPGGLQFDVDWQTGLTRTVLRYEVVHSKPVSIGIYRTGARLIDGTLAEHALAMEFISTGINGDIAEQNKPYVPGIVNFDPKIARSHDLEPPVPAGTFRAAAARGFEKTQTVDAFTADGLERAVSISRNGDRVWLSIHLPGRKNGWSVSVDFQQLEWALSQVHDSSGSPFAVMLAS